MKVNQIDETLGVLETPYFWVFLNQLQRSVLLNTVQGKILSRDYPYTHSTTIQFGDQMILVLSNFPIPLDHQKHTFARSNYTLFLYCCSFVSIPDFIPVRSFRGNIIRDEGNYEWDRPHYWLVQSRNNVYIEGVDQKRILHEGLKRLLGGKTKCAASYFKVKNC